MRRKIHIHEEGDPGDQKRPAENTDHVETASPEQTGAAAGADPPASESRAEGAQAADASAGGGARPELEARVAALQAQVEKLTREVEQEKSQHLRSLADFQNFRRRKDEESLKDRQFANRELIIALLPIIDNFERALAAAETSQSYDALIGGVKLTQRQLQDFLRKNGVEPIESVGLEFDPNLHEAVMRVEDDEKPANTVVEELQRGYRMHDRVVRPSMVKVASGA